MTGKKYWGWFSIVALVALARNVKSTGRPITAIELSQWASDDHIDFPHGIAEMAMTALCSRGYLRIEGPRHNTNGAINRWFITPNGQQAAKVALQISTPGAAPDVGALSTRLWNLLRIRRHLTATEAAETLVDTGDNFNAQTKRIGALLAAWAKYAPKVVSAAKKREAGGRIRYILELDIGRWPPPSRSLEVHPREFARMQEVPQRFRKTAQKGIAP